MYKLSKNKDEEIKEAEFHKKRIAFMIINDDIMFLQNSPMTHFEWAKSIEDKVKIDLSNFDKITRGYYLNNEIFFYQGNFDANDQVISDAKKYTKIICNKFNLNNPSVYAGMEIGEVGTRWKPKVKIF